MLPKENQFGCLQPIETIELPPLAGTRTIRNDGKEIFHEIDPDFVLLNIPDSVNATEQASATIHDLTSDASFRDMFPPTIDLLSLCLTQDQVLHISEAHRKKLAGNDSITFFLMKGVGKIWMSCVLPKGNRYLAIFLHDFNFTDEWGYESRIQVVCLTPANVKLAG